MEYKVGERYEIVGHVEDSNHVNGNIGDIVLVTDCTSGEWYGQNKDKKNILLKLYKLKKLEEPMFKAGDTIENKYRKAKVLFVTNDLIAYTDFIPKEELFIQGHVYYATIENAKRLGWKLKEDNQTEISMNEIADKFGIPVKDLKIKKEK